MIGNRLILSDIIKYSEILIWKATKIPTKKPGKKIVNQIKLKLETKVLSNFSEILILEVGLDK